MNLMRKAAVLMLSIAATSAFAADTLTAKSALSSENKEPSKAKARTVRDRSFDNALESMYPLTPSQIRSLLESKDDDDDAIYSDRIPKMVSESRKLMVEPGSVIPRLSLVPGYVSSIVFVDSTGEPWPITSYTPRSTRLFHFEKLEDLEPGNMLTLQAMREVANGSIAITLKGRDVPIVIQLGTPKPGKKYSSDSVIAFHVQAMGPNATRDLIGEPISSPLGNDMLSFLDNIPPADAVELKISPSASETKIWRMNSTLYLRTKHAPRWPAWSPEIARGAGNVYVYKLPLTHSLMMSVNGRVNNYSVGEQ